MTLKADLEASKMLPAQILKDTASLIHKIEGDPAERDYYDFRLYKGYNMLESGLLFKERVSGREFSIILKSDMFENGTVYTWSL